MTGELSPGWRRAGQAAALVGMALLGLVDVTGGRVFLLGGGIALPAALAQVALAVATAAVWLPAHRQGSPRLALAAGAVATWSLATTAAYAYLRHSAGLDGLVPLRGSDSLWGLAESCGLLGIVFVAARRAAPRAAPAVVAVTGLAVAALPLRADTGAVHLIVGMAYALLAAGTAAAGMYLRLAETARRRQLAAVRAEQRAEFARDLHDFIAHHVTGIVVQAQGARYVAERDPGRAVAALEQIERAGAQTMTAMRRMVGVLRDGDAPVAPLAGAADLPELVDAFRAAGPVGARLRVDGPLDDLPIEVTSSAYRIVMEALTNVRQHAAGARRVDVRLGRTPEGLLVRVSDDGPGRGGGRGGFGLAGLAERVGALGGTLHAGPGDGGGWVVEARLPLSGGVPVNGEVGR
ncbi:sensor histidine kinase [Micromonospora okii]|uniref:sensor histidine kinase n=1 Tax=Micromonospora okii TaxID=1182970 RepID=UPI001E63EA73|nr:histidine kinase [Micromonospora okii]